MNAVAKGPDGRPRCAWCLSDPVYVRYHTAYSTLVRAGYEIEFTMVRMQRGKQEDYEDPTHLVLDDWR